MVAKSSKALEKKLREQEDEARKLRAVFDSLDEPIYVSDPQTYEILYVNKAFETLFGGVAGQKCHEAVYGLENPCPFCTNPSLFGDNSVSTYVWNNRNLITGRWYRLMDKAIDWPDGRRVRCEMALDITERMRTEELLQEVHNELKETNQKLRVDILKRERAERALLESQKALAENEEKFRLAFENAVDAIFWADAGTGILLNVNKAAEKLLERDRGEIIGKHHSMLHPPEDQRAYEKMFEEHVRARGYVDGEGEVLTSRGKRVPVHITAAVTPVGGREVNQGIFRDVTLRREAQKALKASEARYRLLLEASADCVAVYDTEGRITYVNPAFEETFGYTQEELLGKKVDFVPDEAWPETREAIEKMKRGEKVRMFETRRRTKDGRILNIQLSSALFPDNSGKSAGNVVILRDISQQKKLEEELLRAKKLEATGLLAGGLAHDFGNLLAIILLNLELARTVLDDDNKAAGHLAEAHDACLKGRDLTYKFVTFSEGGAPLRRPLSAERLVDLAKNTCEKAQGLKLDIRIPQGLLPVYADERQAPLALAQILENAAEATAPDATIVIDARNMAPEEAAAMPGGPSTGHPCVQITVRDQGPGMPPEALSRAFDPYFSTKQRGTEKGMGLGLAMAWSIMRRHGGAISIDSEPGTGTSVNLVFPAAAGPGPAKK